MAQPELTFIRLHHRRPLDEARVQAVLLMLASERKPAPAVFELRAGPEGVAHLLGCHPGVLARVKRLLGDQLPGISFTKAPERPAASEVGRMRLKPSRLPLQTDTAEQVTRALLSATAVRLSKGESLVVQVVLGRPHAPKVVHPTSQSPHQSWWQPLVRGTEPATAEERRVLRVRAEDASFAATVRVGVSSADPARARRLMLGVQSALATARAPGVRMDFIHEQPRALTGAPGHRWPLELAVAELVGLLGWPLGEDELPGMAPLHPRPVRPSGKVPDRERVFARSGVPGDDRVVGIGAADALFHGVAYGPSGSGKSTAIAHLIVADMLAGRPVAVLDPKRQLIDDILARVPIERLDDVVVLDAADDPVVGFNPLDVTGRDPDVVVDGILSVFGALFTDGWGPRTLDIFSGTLRTLARASVGGPAATLVDIPRILTDHTFRRSVVGRVAADEGLAQFWAWYEDLSPQAQAAAVSAPLNKLRQLLLRPSMVRMLDQRDTRFQLRNIWRENKIVLVPLNEGLLGAGTAEMLGSLIVADLWQSVQERAAESNPEKRPGTVYVDEAPRFIHLPTSLADALAVSRSLGVGWFLAAQFARQFPREMREAVDMNARSKIVFATEYEDAKHFARGEKHLTSEDFRSLARFQAYANLVADGHPQGWALVETLPPTATTIAPGQVMAHSRTHWATVAADPSSTAQTMRDETASAEPGPPSNPGRSEASLQPDLGGMPVGRKRRTR